MIAKIIGYLAGAAILYWIGGLRTVAIYAVFGGFLLLNKWLNRAAV